MRISDIELFYASERNMTLAVDGSQDALLVRVTTEDGVVGWGESESSPLTSIAAFIAPMSHGACRPVIDSVQGETVTTPSDIARIAAKVDVWSLDLLQAPHSFSGIEIAIWDALGKTLDEPVWRLLGHSESRPKRPYASVLFGDSPAHTLSIAQEVVRAGYTAAKFGWGPFGLDLAADREHVMAAREGLGSERLLMVDAGQVWESEPEQAAARLPLLIDAGVTWLEEPFNPHSYSSYRRLRQAADGRVSIAAGESSHGPQMAEALLEQGGVDYIQIDAGRIGGIGPAMRVARAADRAEACFVNHTFTSALALSASLQPYAGSLRSRLCETPAALSALATAFAQPETSDLLAPGEVRAPDAPGLGVRVDLDAIADRLVDVKILVDDVTLFASPTI